MRGRGIQRSPGRSASLRPPPGSCFLVFMAMNMMACWGCGDRSTPADGGVDAGVDARAATFVGNRSEDPCAGAISVCKGMFAGCKLDAQHYISGSLPGERKFIVTSAAGKKIRLLFYLESKLSPGTETELSWFEPGCSGEKTLKLSTTGADLFAAAGSDNTFIAEQVMTVSGDHLVTVWSDAVAKFLLRADVVN